eukprot:gnl/TRDRNA2_/TRDRNA2_172444_c0_seq6.p1 gnl/TRDRNA2_/TRDRNA2_172444_c0~~gnl/TRDRNA2_/TRDRNA2_172444_c0_seq6.p1  ORF type:complete len:367 (+),score=41.02 gnl/TRDRNA2_/TRDRNA2_172444_c0_seq6:87-1187(+)
MTFTLRLFILHHVAYGLRLPHSQDVVAPVWSGLADWSRNATKLSLIRHALKNKQPVVIEPFFTADFAEQVFQKIAVPAPLNSKNAHPDVDQALDGWDQYMKNVRHGQLQWMDQHITHASGALSNETYQEFTAARQLCEKIYSLVRSQPRCKHKQAKCFNSKMIKHFPFVCSADDRPLYDVVDGLFPLAQNLIQEPLAPAAEADGVSSPLLTVHHFFEGDFFALHSDASRNRALSVTVHMTKHPNKMKDGGEYLWCGERLKGMGHKETFVPTLWPDARLFRPGFNRALLFKVHDKSNHAVLPVRKGATVLRRSVQWWYMYPEGGSPSNFHTSPTKSDAVPWSLRSIGNRVRPTVHTESTSNKATCEL